MARPPPSGIEIGHDHFLELAKEIGDSQELRDSYLALALQYERLARLLEKGDLTSTS